MPDENCFRDIGAIEARLEHVEKENEKLRMDVAQLQNDRAKLAGMGAIVSLIFMAVGFLFADVMKGWANRMLQ